MKAKQFSTILVSLFLAALFSNVYGQGGSPEGVHFKINGKQYDIPLVRAVYVKKENRLMIYNNGFVNGPETEITLSIGSNFTGGNGTFKSDANEKGFVFGFSFGSLKNITGYAAGKNDEKGEFTVASTPISITVTGFSMSGSDFINGNVTTQGTFSGTVYDFRNKKTVALTDGTFNVHPAK